MLEKSFAILFSLRKPKGYTKGEVPIYMRITANGERKEISVKHSCTPDRWNDQAQRAKGTNEASRTLNARLDTLERKVQADVADIMGFNATDRVCNWEKGRAVPSLVNLLRLSALFQVNVRELYPYLYMHIENEVDKSGNARLKKYLVN